MRVVINQLASLKRKAGVGHYAAELVAALRARRDSGMEVMTYPEGWVRRGCERFFRSTAVSDRPSADKEVPWRARVRRWARGLGQALVGRHFRRFLHRERITLYHEPNFVPFPCDQPTIVTIHDLSVLLRPEWHPPDRVRYFEQHFAPRLRQCSHVQTVTETIREEVIRCLGFKPSAVSRAYHGVRDQIQPATPAAIERLRRQLELPDRYLLHLGTIEPRKNLNMLLRAYLDLSPAVRSRCGLVLAGAWGWNSADTCELFEREARHQGVRHVGYVADEDLPAIYTGADALVFPTHYEGFGFPAIEMMACGGAVLASTDPAVMEISGRRAFHIPSEDADGWRAAMQRVIEDADWRRELRRGVLEQASRFTWQRCAAQTLAAYRRALGLEAPANDLAIWPQPAAA